MLVALSLSNRGFDGLSCYDFKGESMSKSKMMKLLDPVTGLMEGKACGARHHANAEAGRYRRGSWQCRNSCTPADMAGTFEEKFEAAAQQENR